MKQKAAPPTLAEDVILWASSAGSLISGVAPPVPIVEGVANRRVARAAQAKPRKRAAARPRAKARRVAS